jgi:hypothetical protein
MKTRGERLHDALVAVGQYLIPWRKRTDEEKKTHENAAAEYDGVVSSELSSEVLSFVNEAEVRAQDPAFNNTSYAAIGRKDVLALGVIIKQQAAWIEAQRNALERLDADHDAVVGRLAKLEDACRNVLTTEPPPPSEAYSAWSGSAQTSDYQAWFHRQFNLTQVANLLEHSNDNHGQ